VGERGSVLATDIDLSWLDDGALPPSVEVKQHDVGVDPAPSGSFDLVHARLVLVHVTQRTRALQTMIDSLRPGGWLVVEDADPGLQPLICIDEYGAEQRLANHLRRGFRHLMAERGADLSFGRTLPRLLRSGGLVDVEADAYFPITSPANDVLERATMAQTRVALVAAGLATDDEIDAHLANIEAGHLDLSTSPMVSAWGRKPGPAPPSP
jgi:SAM-dependent methyltransferase